LYLSPSLKSCVWPCIWRALSKFHFGVSAFVKVSGPWGILRDCVQPHNWWGVWVAMIMLWASQGTKKQNLFIARCLDLWKLVYLWVLLDAFWSKRSQNSEVISIVEHAYLSRCFCRQKLWNIWLQFLKQYKTVLAREESCWSCVRQASTFLVTDCLGSFIFFLVRIGLVLKKIPLLNTLLSQLVLISFILVWPVLLAQVLPRPQLIFPSKTWFFGIYLKFQWQKSLGNQYLLHSESKSYQINSIKSCSSRSFQQYQKHIPIPPKFSATI
jgi:hypothetical protein